MASLSRSKLLRELLVNEPGLRPIRFKSVRVSAMKKTHPLDESFSLAGRGGGNVELLPLSLHPWF
jgi:hypothetical protein